MPTKSFESGNDRIREKETLSILAEAKGLEFELMEKFSLFDAKLFKGGKCIAYGEVKTYRANFKNVVPYIFISLMKLASLQKLSIENRIACCIIYRFNDCIGYYFLDEINGAKCGWGGRKKREGSKYDQELLIYIPKSLLKLISL